MKPWSKRLRRGSARLMSTPNWGRVLPSGFMKYLKQIRKPLMSANTWVKPGKPSWKRCGPRCGFSGLVAKPPVCLRFLLNRKNIFNKILWSEIILNQTPFLKKKGVFSCAQHGTVYPVKVHSRPYATRIRRRGVNDPSVYLFYLVINRI